MRAHKPIRQTNTSKASTAGKRISADVTNTPTPLDTVLSLHSTLGNKAVQRLVESGALQPKLTVGAPNEEQLVAIRSSMPAKPVEAPGNPVQRHADDDVQQGLASPRLANNSTFAAILRGQRVLAFGSTDAAAITTVQEICGESGNDPGPIDGIWGPLTQRGVTGFQSAHGLAADGIVGPNTVRYLDKAGGDADTKLVPKQLGKINMGLFERLLDLLEVPPLPEQANNFAQLALFEQDDVVQQTVSSTNVPKNSSSPATPGETAAAVQMAADRIGAALRVTFIEPYPVGRFKEPPAGITDASSRLRFGAPTPAETRWLYNYSMSYGLLVLLNYARTNQGNTTALDSRRLSVVNIALGEVGKVEAQVKDPANPSGPGVSDRDANRCVGADRLKNYYDKAGEPWRDEVGDWRLNVNRSQSSGPFKGYKRTSWCQMFCTWARRMAGLSGAYHTRGSGYIPKPGDSIYIDTKNQHEGIVIAVEGNKVVTVDGNMDTRSATMVNQRVRNTNLTYRETIL